MKARTRHSPPDLRVEVGTRAGEVVQAMAADATRVVLDR